MSPKSFAILFAITLIAVLAAVGITVTRDTGSGVRGDGTLMFEGLIARVNDVATLKVTRGGEVSTIESTLKDGARQWYLKEKNGYPVPVEIVRAVAAGVAQLRAVEAKTARPALYGRLKVGDPTKKNSKGALVELFDAKGAKMAAIISGLDKSGYFDIGDVYVRRPDEDRAWLARGKVPVPDKQVGWLNQMIVEVDLPRVRETTLNVPGQKPLRVFKKTDDDRDFTLEGMPKGYELKELFGAEDISRAIQQLSFEDVKPLSEIGIDLSATPRAHHVTFDGLIVDVWAKDVGGKLWVAVKAQADPAPKAPKKVDKAKVEKDIAKINGTTHGWAYTLNAFETKNLRKTMAGMIQPVGGATKASDTKQPKK